MNNPPKTKSLPPSHNLTTNSDMSEEDDALPENGTIPLCVFFKGSRSAFKLDELGLEIARIALPAAMALTADPIASLVDTAFIGQIGFVSVSYVVSVVLINTYSVLATNDIKLEHSTGPIELAAVGVSIALFNQFSRIAIFPLVSVTTSFVAEEDAVSRMNNLDSKDCETLEHLSENKKLIPRNNSDDSDSTNTTPRSNPGKKQIASASSAIIIGAILGLIQAVFLILAAKPLLSFMGVKSDSKMLVPAQQYLKLRSLGAPAVLLSLAMQGVFRGLKDTKTPLFATVVGDSANIVLDPIFIFVFKMGVRGAAISHVISQYLISIILFWKLKELVDIMPPNLQYLQFGRFLKNGFLLLTRVIAVTFCVTLSASMAARLGPTQMAAFQVCLQVWLASSLLADGLAVAGQAILASAFARKDYSWATSTASRVLQLGLALGLVLAVFLGFGLHFGARVFSKDEEVLRLIGVGISFVAATQPINALAFVFDGVNFGASDFAYAAYSMVAVAVVSVAALFVLSYSNGFVGIWIALTVYMSLRACAGFWRIGTGTGPWKFLRS